MARLTQVNPETTTGATQQLLAGVKAKLGMVPNLMRSLANSPAALEGYLGLSGSASKGVISLKRMPGLGKSGISRM